MTERPRARLTASLAGLCVLLVSAAAHAGGLPGSSPDTKPGLHAWLGSFCTTESCRGARPASPWSGAAFAATVAAMVGLARRREPGV